MSCLALFCFALTTQVSYSASDTSCTSCNINSDGTKKSNATGYLDKDFKDITALFKYLDLGDGKSNFTISDNTIKNLYKAATGFELIGSGFCFGGTDMTINTNVELENVLKRMEKIKNQDLFGLVNSNTLSMADMLFYPMGTNIANSIYGGLKINFTASNAKSYGNNNESDTYTNTTDKDALTLKNSFDAMYRNDPDFRTMMLAVKTRIGSNTTLQIQARNVEETGRVKDLGGNILWIDKTYMNDFLKNPNVGSYTFGKLKLNNIQWHQDTMVHEMYHILGWSHEGGLNQIELLPLPSPNASLNPFFDAWNGKNNRRIEDEYSVSEAKKYLTPVMDKPSK